MSARRPWRRSLALRTVAGVVGLVAVVLALMGTTTALVTARTLEAQLDDAVHQAMSRSSDVLIGRAPGAPRDDPPAQEGAAPEGTGQERPEQLDPLSAPGQPVGVLAWVLEDEQTVSARYLAEDGTVRELSGEDLEALRGSGVLESAVAPQEQTEAPVREAQLSIGSYRVAAARAPDETVPPLTGAAPIDPAAEGGGAGGGQTVVTGLPRTQVQRTEATVVTTVALGSTVALLVIAAVGLWWVRRSLRPLRRISRAAAEVAALPLDEARVPVGDHLVRGELAREGSEVGDVGRALNTLLLSVDEAMGKRDASEAQLRRFVADASHELRTPLASVRGYADMLRLGEQLSPSGQQALQRLLAQSLRMSALVEDLLLLARLDAQQDHPRAEEPEAVDLGEIVAEALMDARAAGPGHAWALEVPEHPVPVRAAGAQLQQAVANLLSNARKHTPDGSRVRVRLSTRPSGGPSDPPATAVLVVEDDGPGIPSALLPAVFDRFARGDDARGADPEGSSGLGLAIVRTVVEAAGGRAAIASPLPDGAPGTRAEIRLPLA